MEGLQSITKIISVPSEVYTFSCSEITGSAKAKTHKTNPKTVRILERAVNILYIFPCHSKNLPFQSAKTSVNVIYFKIPSLRSRKKSGMQKSKINP